MIETYPPQPGGPQGAAIYIYIYTYMTDIRNPLIATNEETGNIIKKSAVAELCGTNAELMRNKVLAENSATFSLNSLVVFQSNCWDITRNVACCWGSFGGSSASPAAQPNFPNRLGCPCGTNAE